MARVWRLRLPQSSGNPETDSWMRGVTEAFGDVRFNFRAVSSNYSMEDTDQIVQAETAGIVITLPSATNEPGKWIPSIKNVTTGNVSVNCLGSQTIDSKGTFTLTPDDSISVYSDRTNWRIS
jgi:hypothetical protein